MRGRQGEGRGLQNISHELGVLIKRANHQTIVGPNQLSIRELGKTILTQLAKEGTTFCCLCPAGGCLCHPDHRAHLDLIGHLEGIPDLV